MSSDSFCHYKISLGSYKEFQTNISRCQLKVFNATQVVTQEKKKEKEKEKETKRSSNIGSSGNF